MQRLGHKNIKNTLLYIQLEEALFQGETNYISKVAKTEKDICSLVEAGFEYVTEFEGSKNFQKKKTLTYKNRETLASGTLGHFTYKCAGGGI